MGSIFGKSPPQVITPSRLEYPRKALTNKASDFAAQESVFDSVGDQT